MPLYRVYFVDNSGHIDRPPEVIDCENDQAAAEKARQFIDGFDIELWLENRMVLKLPKK
jgi:hypothetical protein